MRLTCDFETRSRVDLKKCGAYVYAQDPSTDVLCSAVMVDNNRPRIWVNEEAFPWIARGMSTLRSQLPLMDTRDMINLLLEAERIEAHNAGSFERLIHHYVGEQRYGWPAIPLEKWRCSAAKCAMHALPRPLGEAARVLGLGAQKDMDGYSLMMKFCKPRKATKADASEWYENIDDFIKLCRYCMQDVITEHELSKRLHDLPDDEQRLWALDQRINDRGVYIDTTTAKAMIDLADGWSKKLIAEFRKLTNYTVEKPTQVEKLLVWLENNGLPLDDLRKQRLAEVLKNDDEADADPFAEDSEKLAPPVRRALEIRASISKASVKKYDAMLRCTNQDSRARGLLLYHGASTGRWTGKLIQVQNFPRGSMDFDAVCQAIDNVGAGSDWMATMYEDPMAVASSCLRATMRAAPGNELIVADYSAIEGRILAWLADETPVVEAYRQGLDLYKVAASVVYHVPYDQVTKAQRQIGKVVDLACGYQGWVGAFHSMAANYGVRVSDDEAAEAIKAWREGRPDTVALWHGLEQAALRAVKDEGSIYEFGKIAFRSRDFFLRMRLPSGRVLFYPNPRVDKRIDKYDREKTVVLYDGQDTKAGSPTYGKWSTLNLYGGKSAENAVQALARDIMVNGMFNVEDSGYRTIFSVHDELVAEVPAGSGDVKEFEALLCKLPPWADGLPLKAAGYRSVRYRKD